MEAVCEQLLRVRVRVRVRVSRDGSCKRSQNLFAPVGPPDAPPMCATAPSPPLPHTSMAVTMDVDAEDQKPPRESLEPIPHSEPLPEPNGHDEPRSQSPPQLRDSVSPTARSPPPVPESSAQTPAPNPEPKILGPYKPNYRPHLILSGHSRSVSSIKFSPDGTMLASCGE